jgi:exosortase
MPDKPTTPASVNTDHRPVTPERLREGGSPITDHLSVNTDHYPLRSTAKAEKGLLLALGAAFLLFAYPVVKLIIAVYEFNPDYAHGYLIPLVAAYAVYAIWKAQPGITLRISWGGVPIILLGVLLVTVALWYRAAFSSKIATSTGSQFLGGIGLWLCLAGLLLSTVDRKTRRKYIFPLLYLLLAVPLPANLTQQLVLELRAVVSGAAQLILNAAGVLAYREGNLIHLPNVTLGIEDACSGIRSLAVMVAWAVAAGWVTGCRRGRFLLIVASAVPISFLQNLLRVLISGLLGNFVDPSWAEGWRHETIGWATFALAAGVFVVIANRISNRGKDALPAPIHAPERDAPRITPNPPSVFHHSAIPLYTTLVALFTISAFSEGILGRHYESRILYADAPRTSFDQFPTRIGDYTLAETIAIPQRQMELLRPTDSYAALFRANDGRSVSVMLLYWSLAKPDAHPHDPDVCIPSAGWLRQGGLDFNPKVNVDSDEELRGRVYVKGQTSRVLVFWWHAPWQRTSDNLLDSMLDKLSSLRESLTATQYGKQAAHSVYVYVDSNGDDEIAYDLAEEFAALLQPELAAFGLHGPIWK